MQMPSENSSGERLRAKLPWWIDHTPGRYNTVTLTLATLSCRWFPSLNTPRNIAGAAATQRTVHPFWPRQKGYAQKNIRIAPKADLVGPGWSQAGMFTVNDTKTMRNEIGIMGRFWLRNDGDLGLSLDYGVPWDVWLCETGFLHCAYWIGGYGGTAIHGWWITTKMRDCECLFSALLEAINVLHTQLLLNYPRIAIVKYQRCGHNPARKPPKEPEKYNRIFNVKVKCMKPPRRKNGPKGYSRWLSSW